MNSACLRSLAVLGLMLFSRLGVGGPGGPGLSHIAVERFERRLAVVIESEIPASDFPATLESSLLAVAKHLENLGVSAAGAPVARYAYFTEESTKFEAGFFVSQSVSTEGDMKLVEFPEAEVVVTVFLGNPDESSVVHENLNRWIVDNGYEITGNPWEEYLDDPETTPMAKQRTRISYPVKRKN